MIWNEKNVDEDYFVIARNGMVKKAFFTVIARHEMTKQSNHEARLPRRYAPRNDELRKWCFASLNGERDMNFLSSLSEMKSDFYSYREE